MNRALDMESTLTEAYDRLVLVHRTLMDLSAGDHDKETGTAISGCMLVVGDLLEQIDATLDQEPKS